MREIFLSLSVGLLIGPVGRAEVALPRYFAVNPAVLAANKECFKSGDPGIQKAVKALLKEAEAELNKQAPAVTDKVKAPSTGTKHDYMTVAPYYWPDPKKADGLPYIRHDGKVNPEARNDVYDHNRIGRMADAVETLALAYYYSGKDAYAEQAAQFLRVWFLNPSTRMNPNLNFAQAIPGRNTGRGVGIIEGRNLSNAADCVALLAGSPAWTKKDDDALKSWLATYLDWLLTSDNGREEAAARNNHGTFYDTQVMRLALILGRNDLARQVAEASKEKRIAVQIEAEGRQPLELERTAALGYSRFNLEALFELATMGERVGVDLWHYKCPGGGSIAQALDFILPYVIDPAKKWPYKQIKKVEPLEFAPLLAQAVSIYQNPRYQDVLSKIDNVSGKRMQLLYPQKKTQRLNIREIENGRVMKAAKVALEVGPIRLTDFKARLSEGGPNDFYSNGDYWWPDPKQPEGLPYIQRDGQTNPDNFSHHRMAVRRLRDAVSALGAAYKLTGDEAYAAKASELLEGFFIRPATRMAPHLKYAQAIPGVSSGRGIGIIDTLHLIEIPMAIQAMQGAEAFGPELKSGLRKWFKDYLDWMITSSNGKDEAEAKNNHAVAFWLQAAVFARFVGDEPCLTECRRQFTEIFVGRQMALDGSFPAELGRTKPYAYSIFQLDNMATLCQVISTPKHDFWSFELPDGRGIRKALAYLYPFIADKSKWPLKPDVQAWDGWPSRQPHLVFGGLALDRQSYLDLWKRLPPDPSDPEVQRNIAITQPLLWVE